MGPFMSLGREGREQLVPGDHSSAEVSAPAPPATSSPGEELQSVVTLLSLPVGCWSVAQEPSGRVSSKEQTWQSAGLVWPSEHEVAMVSQLLKRMQTCLKTVVIHLGNYSKSPERAALPKVGEELAETVLQAEGSALLLYKDVAKKVDNVPVLRLALSLGGAGAPCRSGDAVRAG